MNNLLLQCVKEDTETIPTQHVLTVSNVAFSKGEVRTTSTDFLCHLYSCVEDETLTDTKEPENQAC